MIDKHTAPSLTYTTFLSVHLIIILLTTSVVNSTSLVEIPNSTYLGCFQDLPYQYPYITSISQLSSAVCVALCSYKGYSFAGLEYQTQCTCGDHYPYNKSTNPAVCGYDCPANPTEKCGGNNVIDVYSLTASPLSISLNLLGCYNDCNSTWSNCTMANSTGHPINGLYVSNNDPSIPAFSVDINYCSITCAVNGYSLFGISNNNCYCGNSSSQYSKYGNSTLCSSTCRNDSNICGSNGVLAVYSITDCSQNPGISSCYQWISIINLTFSLNSSNSNEFSTKSLFIIKSLVVSALAKVGQSVGSVKVGIVGSSTQNGITTVIVNVEISDVSQPTTTGVNTQPGEAESNILSGNEFQSELKNGIPNATLVSVIVSTTGSTTAMTTATTTATTTGMTTSNAMSLTVSGILLIMISMLF